MGSKKTNKILRVYGLLGKILFACAGGIVGFVIVGPIMAIAGILVGALAGYFLQKGVLKAAS